MSKFQASAAQSSAVDHAEFFSYSETIANEEEQRLIGFDDRRPVTLAHGLRQFQATCFAM
ncbi:hypothetical protein V1291_001235 [Nitrobacteraceae bacterium AZCC 1564]